ncbi:MAG: PD-(D/E)XK nuclease family protein, partial [Gammaproteobacteria bacterium]
VVAELAGLRFGLRIDRIDTLEGGQALLIDYKTGRSNSATSWMGERPDEPQLPLYALAWSQRDVDGEGPDDVGAIAFGQIHRAQTAFTGLGDGAGLPAGVIAPEASRSKVVRAAAGSWRDWRATSERHLLALATGYAAGIAGVDPKHAKVCERCDLHALCRVAELYGSDADGDWDEIGESEES